MTTGGGYDVHVAGFTELDGRTAYQLWQLRESVFVVEQACAYLELDGRDVEPATRHVWASDESGPVGCLRVLDDGAHARIGRVCVAAPHRGRGLAETLMVAALEVVGDRASRLSAQTYLTRWYLRFGYRVEGPEFLEDGIPHVPMLRSAPAP